MPAQATAYDDPVVSWESWNAPESFDVTRADNNIFRVSQAIPFPGKRRLAGERAAHGADVATAAATTVELDTLAAAGRAFWTLWATQQRLTVYERERELATRFARVAEQRYALGEVPQPDVLQAQVMLTHAITDTSTQQLDVDSARAELLALLSEPPTEALPPPESPPSSPLTADESGLVELAIGHRPELTAQQATIAGEESSVALAEKGYLPDFQVSVGRFVNTGSPNGFGAMLSMSVPLAWKTKYDAAVSEASARRDAAVADRRGLEDMIRRDVHRALLAVRSAGLRYDLFRTTHLPQAEQAIRVTEAAYQAGTVDFMRLIDTMRALVAAHLEHIDAGAALERAFVDLSRAIGTEVPRAPAASHWKGH
jgi:outer membrane protein TolC